MKKLMIVLAAALLFACNSQTKNAETKVESVNPEWIEVVLNVEGMTCDGCENAINSGVESLDGIEKVESSYEEGWTKIKFDQSPFMSQSPSIGPGKNGNCPGASIIS